LWPSIKICRFLRGLGVAAEALFFVAVGCFVLAMRVMLPPPGITNKTG
jgi:hypothetical protein